jgi:DNA-binding response OmpR family regulator
MAPLEKMIENNENESNKHYISIIRSNVKRLHRLIEQLVAYRKHEEGKLTIHYSSISLGDFLFPLFESFEENIASKNITFIHEVQHPDKNIVIDTEKTELILFNLLSNSVKYTKSRGQIKFRAYFDVKNNHMINFEVSDNGIGILPENVSKIFDRFYRSERSGVQSGGFGIGLSFSKSLSDAMNGMIAVQSEPDKFTTIVLSLPYNNTPDQKVQNISEEFPSTTLFEKSNKENIFDKSKPTLLIIDDEIDFRRFLDYTFNLNYNVVLAESGEEAFEKLQNITPQLIICDVMMDGLNGFEVCEKVKSDIYTCQIPVILLTALSADDNEQRSVELGADYYLQKPFSIQLLEAKVKHLINERNMLQEHYSKKSYLPDEALGIPIRERQFLESLNDAIENNMSNTEYCLSDLAISLGYSVSHFNRKLKQITGQVPNLYVRNYRLQKAAEMLLADKDVNIKEVMYEIGISSPSYFSSAFKKVYGIAPSMYRDTIQNQNANSSTNSEATDLT